MSTRVAAEWIYRRLKAGVSGFDPKAVHSVVEEQPIATGSVIRES